MKWLVCLCVFLSGGFEVVIISVVGYLGRGAVLGCGMGCRVRF